MDKKQNSKNRKYSFWTDLILPKHEPYQLRIESDIKPLESWSHTFKYAAIKLLSTYIHTKEDIEKLVALRFKYDKTPLFSVDFNTLTSYQADTTQNDNKFYVIDIWLAESNTFQKIYCEYLTKGADVAYKIDQLFDYFGLEKRWDLRLLNEEGWLLDPCQYLEIDKRLHHISYRDDASHEIEEALENMEEKLQKSSFPIIKNTVRATVEIQKNVIVGKLNKILKYLGVKINDVREDGLKVRDDVISLIQYVHKLEKQHKEDNTLMLQRIEQLYQELNIVRATNAKLVQQIEQSENVIPMKIKKH